MKLKKFTEGDLDKYIGLATEFHTSPASFTAPNLTVFNNNFAHILDHDDAFGWFIEKGNHTVGYVLCSRMFSTEVGAMQLWIEELSVSSKYRGEGIGSLVIEELISRFPDMKRFRLEVAPDNMGAKSLYKRLGYDFLLYEQMIFDRK